MHMGNFIDDSIQKVGQLIKSSQLEKELGKQNIEFAADFFPTYHGSRTLFTNDPLLSFLGVILYAYIEQLLRCYWRDAGNVRKPRPESFIEAAEDAQTKDKSGLFWLNLVTNKEKSVVTDFAKEIDKKLSESMPQIVKKKLCELSGYTELKDQDSINAELAILPYIADILKVQIEHHFLAKGQVIRADYSPFDSAETDLKLRVLRLSKSRAYILYTEDECKDFKRSRVFQGVVRQEIMTEEVACDKRSELIYDLTETLKNIIRPIVDGQNNGLLLNCAANIAEKLKICLLKCQKIFAGDFTKLTEDLLKQVEEVKTTLNH